MVILVNIWAGNPSARVFVIQLLGLQQASIIQPELQRKARSWEGKRGYPDPAFWEARATSPSVREETVTQMPPPPRPRPRRVGGGGSCGPGGGRAAALRPVGSGGICAFHAPSQRLALKFNPPGPARPPLARARSQPAPGIGLQDPRGSISVRGSPTACCPRGQGRSEQLVATRG